MVGISLAHEEKNYERVAALTILEDLVLSKSCDPLLEVAIADGQYGPLLIQKCHAGRQHGHLVLQSQQTIKLTIDLHLLAEQANKQLRQNSKLFACSLVGLIFFPFWLQIPPGAGAAHVPQLKPKAEFQPSGTSSAYGHGKLTEPDNRGTFDL